MYNGGKYVLAPTANDGSDVSECLSDNNSICSADLEVAAHETVETDEPALLEADDFHKRLRYLEETMGGIMKKRSSGTNPTTETANESEKCDDEPNSHSRPSNRGGNIRWDLIPKFPNDIPSSKLWENWHGFIKNFEIATSLSTFVGSSDRAKLLYLSLGKNLQDIISAANIQPDYRDPKCYASFVSKVNDYFKSMVDTAAAHEAFQAMMQEQGESIVTFHAKLTQMARVCEYSPTDEVRYVLAQLLKGMRNQELALAARTYGHDADCIVKAATRVEAYDAGKQTRENNPRQVLAVTRKREPSREREPFHKMRKLNESKRFEKPQMKGVPQGYRQGQRTRCWRCGYQSHKRNTCPALDKTCNVCGRVGHFAATCRSKIKTTVNRVDEKPRNHSHESPSSGWAKELNDDQV